MRIHKYQLTTDDTVIDLALPVGSEILSVANQRDILVLWARVSEDDKMRMHKLALCTTNGTCPVPEDARFIGTALFQGGAYVVHVFERK